MISELIIRALMGGALAALAGIVLRHLLARRQTANAPVLDLARDEGFDIAYKPLRHQQFVRSTDQGNFGELLTAMIMTAKGWRQIDGKVSGPHGIDGVFLRRVDHGWQACLIETKTNSGKYLPRQMSDAKLLKDLDKLYLTAPADLAPAYRALHQAISSGSAALGRELWRHSLESGMTQAHKLGADGEIFSPSDDPSQPQMMQALFTGLRDFDQSHSHIHAD